LAFLTLKLEKKKDYSLEGRPGAPQIQYGSADEDTSTSTWPWNEPRYRNAAHKIIVTVTQIKSHVPTLTRSTLLYSD